MKVSEVIEIKDDNVTSVFNCPAVYKISKLELDAHEGREYGHLPPNRQKPTMAVWLMGHSNPATTGQFLVLDENGLWRCFTKSEMQECSI